MIPQIQSKIDLLKMVCASHCHYIRNRKIPAITLFFTDVYVPHLHEGACKYEEDVYERLTLYVFKKIENKLPYSLRSQGNKIKFRVVSSKN